MMMAIAGIGRDLELRGLCPRGIFDLLRHRGHRARTEKPRTRQRRKSPQHTASIPVDLLHRFLLPDCYQHSPSVYTSTGQRLNEKGQTFVHPVVDSGMVVGELLVLMRDPKLFKSPYKPASTIEQVELIFLAAVDVERFQAAEIFRLRFDGDYRVLPQPICPARLDNLAGIECDRQPDTEKLRGIGIVA